MKRLARPATALLRGMAAWLSPAGARAALPVLMYHRVLAGPDPMFPDEPDAARFAAQLDLLGDLFRIVDLADAVAALGRGTLPARSAAITFDDGYLNNADIAAPLLAARGMTATFFVATGFLDGDTMWNDIVIESLRAAQSPLDLRALDLGLLPLPDWAARRAAVDRLLGALKYLEPDERLARTRSIAALAGWKQALRPMMRPGDLQRLAAQGMAIGAHSVTHPILARLPDAVARREITDGKATLEEILRVPVRSFAYPNGKPQRDYTRRHVELVREAGFESAVTTAWGSCDRNCDVFQVPRIAPWDRSASRYAARLLRAQRQRSPAICS
ncbi:MAG: polysaccharide deacetylase family protein [Gammaproteobacteria bacterium]